uniref:Putative secreted protein n=1 Tax=Anopheles darlingi TaxID=43151 RepID=A0A2M4D3B4_ANODA
MIIALRSPFVVLTLLQCVSPHGAATRTVSYARLMLPEVDARRPFLTFRYASLTINQIETGRGTVFAVRPASTSLGCSITKRCSSSPEEERFEGR